MRQKEDIKHKNYYIFSNLDALTKGFASFNLSFPKVLKSKLH